MNHRSAKKASADRKYDIERIKLFSHSHPREMAEILLRLKKKHYKSSVFNITTVMNKYLKENQGILDKNRNLELEAIHQRSLEQQEIQYEKDKLSMIKLLKESGMNDEDAHKMANQHVQKQPMLDPSMLMLFKNRG